MVFDLMGFNEGFISNLSPELATALGNFLGVLTAAGIVFIVYIIFLIVNAVMNILRNIRVKKIYLKVNELDEKINFLIARHKREEKEEGENKHDKHKKSKSRDKESLEIENPKKEKTKV